MTPQQWKEKLRSAIDKAKTKGYQVQGVNGGGYCMIAPDNKRSQVMGLTTIIKKIEELR